jgi:hypothetical protein
LISYPLLPSPAFCPFFDYTPSLHPHPANLLRFFYLKNNQKIVFSFFS